VRLDLGLLRQRTQAASRLDRQIYTINIPWNKDITAMAKDRPRLY